LNKGAWTQTYRKIITTRAVHPRIEASGKAMTRVAIAPTLGVWQPMEFCHGDGPSKTCISFFVVFGLSPSSKYYFSSNKENVSVKITVIYPELNKNFSITLNPKRAGEFAWNLVETLYQTLV
jgi:hypothetical protein